MCLGYLYKVYKLTAQLVKGKLLLRKKIQLMDHKGSFVFASMRASSLAKTQLPLGNSQVHIHTRVILYKRYIFSIM